jgi:hypothetical protein
MSVILEVIGVYEIVEIGIDLLPLASEDQLITFYFAQRQGFLVII